MREKLGLVELKNEVSLNEFRILNNPVLVSRTNSVSGKLFLAAEMQRFDTIGIDCVAAGVNDLIAMEAKPLMFYDNISCARVKVEKIKEMESGITYACRQGGIAFAGSEIKELPDIFSYDQYDLAGFVTGIIEKRQTKHTPIKHGDVILGLSSAGLHNNGYVIARKKLYLTKASMEIYYETLGGTLGEFLLQPTKMYRSCLEAVQQSDLEVKTAIQVAHGGLDRAIKCMLGSDTGAVIKQKEETMPPLYHMLHRDGNISEEQMRQTFNMGIGMLLVAAEENVDQVAEILENAGEKPVFLGLVETDSDSIRYIR